MSTQKSIPRYIENAIDDIVYKMPEALQFRVRECLVDCWLQEASSKNEHGDIRKELRMRWHYGAPETILIELVHTHGVWLLTCDIVTHSAIARVVENGVPVLAP